MRGSTTHSFQKMLRRKYVGRNDGRNFDEEEKSKNESFKFKIYFTIGMWLICSVAIGSCCGELYLFLVRDAEESKICLSESKPPAICEFTTELSGVVGVGPEVAVYYAQSLDECCRYCASHEQCVGLSFAYLESQCILFNHGILYGLRRGWSRTLLNHRAVDVNKLEIFNTKETCWWNSFQMQRHFETNLYFKVVAVYEMAKKPMTRKDYSGKVQNLLFEIGLHKSQSEKSSKWDFYWGLQWKELNEFKNASLLSHQQINMMPGAAKLVLGDKDSLHRLFSRFSGLAPESYLFPSNSIHSEFSVEGDVWIQKQLNSWSGNGVRVLPHTRLVSEFDEISKSTSLLQRYIVNPLTLKSFKFDTRWWVVITSVDPLRVYMIPTGYVRVAKHRYNTSLEEIDNRCIHITNGNVQSRCSNKKEPTASFPICTNCSGFISMLRSSIGNPVERPHQLVENMVFDTKVVIVKSLLLALPALRKYRAETNARCFQFLAYDIIYDDIKRTPWIEEINTNGYIDGGISKVATYAKNIKGRSPDFVREMFSLVGASGYNRVTYQTELEQQMSSLEAHPHLFRQIQEFIDELLHAGNWEMIYPLLSRKLLSRVDIKELAATFDHSIFSPGVQSPVQQFVEQFVKKRI